MQNKSNATTPSKAVVKVKTPRPEVTANVRKLPWPQDKNGMTSNMKREICRSIGRMAGDPAKLAIVQEVLDISKEYADAKFKEQQDKAVASKKAREERRAKEVLQKEFAQRAYADNIINQAAALNKEAELIKENLEKAKEVIKGSENE
jgi:hypothetical protein